MSVLAFPTVVDSGEVAPPSPRDLAAYFHERTKAVLGEPPPRQITSLVGKMCKDLLADGSSPRSIRRAIEMMIRRRKHPMILPHLVLEAAQGGSACLWLKHPNRLRLTPSQLLECSCSDCIETIPYSQVVEEVLH